MQTKHSRKPAPKKATVDFALVRRVVRFLEHLDRAAWSYDLYRSAAPFYPWQVRALLLALHDALELYAQKGEPSPRPTTLSARLRAAR